MSYRANDPELLAAFGRVLPPRVIRQPPATAPATADMTAPVTAPATAPAPAPATAPATADVTAPATADVTAPAAAGALDPAKPEAVANLFESALGNIMATLDTSVPIPTRVKLVDNVAAADQPPADQPPAGNTTGDGAGRCAGQCGCSNKKRSGQAGAGIARLVSAAFALGRPNAPPETAAILAAEAFALGQLHA